MRLTLRETHDSSSAWSERPLRGSFGRVTNTLVSESSPAGSIRHNEAEFFWVRDLNSREACLVRLQLCNANLVRFDLEWVCGLRVGRILPTGFAGHRAFGCGKTRQKCPFGSAAAPACARRM
jgi:hypothetical protein